MTKATDINTLQRTDQQPNSCWTRGSRLPFVPLSSTRFHSTYLHGKKWHFPLVAITPNRMFPQHLAQKNLQLAHASPTFCMQLSFTRVQFDDNVYSALSPVWSFVRFQWSLCAPRIHICWHECSCQVISTPRVVARWRTLICRPLILY